MALYMGKREMKNLAEIFSTEKLFEGVWEVLTNDNPLSFRPNAFCLPDSNTRKLFFFKKKRLTNPSLFFVYFRSFQTNNTFFTTNECEKCHVHPVSGAGIRTHDLWNVSLLP